MSDLLKKLDTEQRNLYAKINRLDTYIYVNEEFDKLPRKVKRLLKKQLKHMVRYNEVLNKRIELLKGEANNVED